MKFETFYPQYIGWHRRMEAKSELTLAKETYSLERWSQSFGQKPLKTITRKDITEHLAKRKAEGVTNRTLNLDLIALGNCLSFAKKEGHLTVVLTDDVEPLSHETPKRGLVTDEEIEKICSAAGDKNFSNYIRFMQYSGARRESALWVRWTDVDLDNKRITFSLETKYSKVITVTINDRLLNLLQAMKECGTDSPWLFPSPALNGQVANFRRTLERARAKAGLPDFQYHDLRHYFISHAVMSGVDTMTIASWVGHAGPGLINEVYGHLNDTHKQAQAAKLSFGGSPNAGNSLDLTKLTAQDLLALLTQKLSEKQP